MAQLLIEPVGEVAWCRLEEGLQGIGRDRIADGVRREVDRLALDPHDRDDQERHETHPPQSTGEIEHIPGERDDDQRA